MSPADPTREQVAAGQPYLSEQDGRLTLAFSELAVQSTMDIADPARLVLEYSHLMVASLAFVPAPRRIAMIGLGGGSLVKACHRHLQQTVMEVAEISPEVIALRAHFHVPPDDHRLSVHCVDGAQWIARREGEFDLLWVDGFDIGGMAPALTTPRFFDACHDALAEGGVFAMNMYARDALADAWTERIAASFARSAAAVVTADGDNRVVFAARDMAFRLSESRLAQQMRRIERTFGIRLPGFARDFTASRRRLASGVEA